MELTGREGHGDVVRGAPGDERVCVGWRDENLACEPAVPKRDEKRAGEKTVLEVVGGPRAWGEAADLFHLFGQGISGRDLVLLAGGLFLLWKASHEIFVEVEADSRTGRDALAREELDNMGWRVITFNTAFGKQDGWDELFKRHSSVFGEG